MFMVCIRGNQNTTLEVPQNFPSGEGKMRESVGRDNARVLTELVLEEVVWIFF